MSLKIRRKQRLFFRVIPAFYDSRPAWHAPLLHSGQGVSGACARRVVEGTV